MSLKSAFRGEGLGFSPEKRENQRNDIGTCDVKAISKKKRMVNQEHTEFLHAKFKP